MSDRVPDPFRARTIGWSDWSGMLGVNTFWTWRGPGYDEGWETPTRADLVAVRDFIDQWLQENEGEPSRGF